MFGYSWNCSQHLPPSWRAKRHRSDKTATQIIFRSYTINFSTGYWWPRCFVVTNKSGSCMCHDLTLHHPEFRCLLALTCLIHILWEAIWSCKIKRSPFFFSRWRLLPPEMLFGVEFAFRRYEWQTAPAGVIKRAIPLCPKLTWWNCRDHHVRHS